MKLNKITFSILVFIFILPFILGTIYFQYRSKHGGQSTANYGVLVSPMQNIKDYGAKNLWTYVVFSKECGTSCQKRLLMAETTRILSNEHLARVQTIFISEFNLEDSQKPKNIVPSKLTKHLGPISKTQWNLIRKQFMISDEELFSNILLLDPHGNFMMRYPADKQDSKFMIGDLKRLLKYSRIG